VSQATIAREAARWWLDGHDGQRDESAFARWQAADPRHAAQYQHLQALWQVGMDLPGLQRRQQRRQRRRLREACIAVLLLCALGMYCRHVTPPAAQVVRTAAGQIRETPVPDGSYRQRLSVDQPADAAPLLERRHGVQQARNDGMAKGLATTPALVVALAAPGDAPDGHDADRVGMSGDE